jgi:hypothetical protein
MSAITMLRKPAKESPAEGGAKDIKLLIANVERLAKTQLSSAQYCRQNCQALVGALLDYLEGAIALQRAADEVLVERKRLSGRGDLRMRTAVDVPEYPALFSTDHIVGLLAQDLAVGTSGKWPARGVLDIYQLSQGPRFDKRVAEYLLLLVRQLSKEPTDHPPMAA